MQSQESNQTSSELLIMRRFITLRTEYGHDEVDLEMPGDQPISRLLPELLKAINWPVTEGDRRIHYALRTESGHIMKDSETLGESGVENSDTLWIMLAEPEIKVEPGKISSSTKEEYLPDEGPISGFSPIAATTPSPKDRRGTLPSPLPVGVAMNQPALVSPEGWIFILGDPPISIGRASHGKKPDMDLTEIDPEFASSRNHAEIIYEKSQYALIANPTTNGTFINGAEISPGKKCRLKDGDIIQLGFEGVKLYFFSGESGAIPGSLFG